MIEWDKIEQQALECVARQTKEHEEAAVYKAQKRVWTPLQPIR